MQNAKDTFYTVLQARLAALNPARTAVVRSITRPGVLVEENELVSAYAPANVFRLRWTDTKVDTQSALPLVTLTCEVHYATDGNSGNGGMDRGRLLAAMDAELASAVSALPQSAVKMNYAALAGQSGASPVAMSTSIFWSDAAFGKTLTDGERLSRIATIEVHSYQEAGEL